MEVKEFRNKHKEAKRILDRARVEYKKVRTALSDEVLEPYGIHVGSEVVYKRKKYKVHNAIINSKNLMYVILTPIGFKYFSEKIPIEYLV